MGYYSDVAIVIRGKEELILPQIASLNLTGGEPTIKVLKEFCVRRTTPGCVVMVYEAKDIEWHRAYPDVSARIDVFHHFEELSFNTPDLDGAFICMGEASDDIKESFFGDNGRDLARVSRSLECDYGHDPTEDIRNTTTE